MEEGICSGCGVATLSISYYDLGYTTGEMAAKVLTGEADISTMPVEYTNVTKKYNKTICDDLGMTVPEVTRPLRNNKCSVCFADSSPDREAWSTLR